MYPVPPELIRIRETTPLVIIAVAAAPDPPPPTIETNGEDVYPVPPSVTVTSLIEPSTTTEALAPLPPPPAIVIAGGDAASYPEPALVIPILVTAPNVLVKFDLYDHTDTPFTHVPIGPELIRSLVDIVVGTLGNLVSFLWLPGRRADPGKGPIL